MPLVIGSAPDVGPISLKAGMRSPPSPTLREPAWPAAASSASSGMPRSVGLDLAFHLVGDVGGAGRRAGMAAVEHRPDERALVADRVEGAADVVVDQRVGHALVAVDPLADVVGQEDLVEPVGLVAGARLRLLRAVAGKMQIDEIVALDLGGERVERRLDALMRRRAGRAFDAVGEHRHVLGRELDRVGRLLEQIVANQRGVVLRPDQPVLLRQVRIFGAGDKQRMIGLRRGGERAHRRHAGGGKRRRAGQKCAAGQNDHRSSPKPRFPERHIGCDFVSILNARRRNQASGQGSTPHFLHRRRLIRSRDQGFGRCDDVMVRTASSHGRRRDDRCEGSAVRSAASRDSWRAATIAVLQHRRRPRRRRSGRRARPVSVPLEGRRCLLRLSAATTRRAWCSRCSTIGPRRSSRRNATARKNPGSARS